MAQQTSTDPRGEIQDLLSRIAQLADDGTVEEYLEHFTADAVWESQPNPVTGMAAQQRRGIAVIEEGVRERRAGGIQGPGTASRHVITTVAVSLDSETEASSTAYWLFFRDTTTQPKLAGVGRYDDTHRYEDGRWKLAHRRITVG
ncbi:nuclear transport factor 2 family protein [Rhodococcus sp. SGAir0479]|uniref:nuclear transport factor 2 family protein n=1 Tax=Rhodococcus sp. SGAir0479 TaxID=2567884 RepID=UPI0010CD2FF9|nr:nuclear transport factor 2 family protein [Rhodococcus sp. SGAir0479]QCQ92577.1 nuclear transport factor 2 family protein [Rhodococcus sp. SGAir0479]